MGITRTQAEDFLYMESDLLDQRRFEDWAGLFTEDGTYWLPMVDGSDPDTEPSIQYDDARLLAMRVHQLVKKPHYAQIPPSRTVHAVTNVRVSPAQRADETTVRCTLMVTELREGNFQQLGLGEQRVFSGHCEYRLRHGATPSSTLAIALKKVVLINRDQPIVNLSFFI